MDAVLYRREQAVVDRQRRLAGLVFAVLLGLAAIAVAVTISALQTRYLAAVIVATAGLVGLPLLGSRQRVRDLMVVSMCLGLSIGFSISFLHRVIVPGKYVPFMGEAEGVTVSLTLVACAMYVAVRWFERSFYGLGQPWRFYVPLVWPSLAFMMIGAMTLGSARDLPLVTLEEFRLLCLLGVTLVVMNFTQRERSLYFWVLGGSVMLQAGLAIMQFVTGRALGLGVFGEGALTVEAVDFQKVFRPTGTIGDPNILAYFFEMTAPVMLALFYISTGKLERLFYLAASGAALAAIIVTLSRAAWMTVPVTFGFITLMVYGRKLFTLRAAVVGIFLLGVLTVAAVYVYPLVARRLFGDDAGSTSHRIPLDISALRVIWRFPWFGVGLNNYAASVTSYDTTGYAWVRPNVDYVVHNLFLLVWTEVGTIGFVAFLWYFGSVFLATYMLRAADARSRAIALAISAGFFAHWMHGMVDPGFKLNLTISQLVAAQIGIVGALALAARPPRRKPAFQPGVPHAA